MTPEQRAEITCMSQSGEDLSPEWARTLFPPRRPKLPDASS